MDRITESYLKSFKELFELPSSVDQPTLFEHFVNFTVMDPFVEDILDLEEVNIGKNGTIGIDGFALIVNQKIFYDVASLDAFLTSNSELSATLIFVQSKTVVTFQGKELQNFGFAACDFLATAPSLAWPPHAKEKVSLVNRLLEDIAKLREKPTCYMFYVTLGKYQSDANLDAIEKSIVANIEDLNIFSSTKLHLIDANAIHSRHKKIGQAISKTIEIHNHLLLPDIKGIKQSDLCFVKAKDFVDFICNDDGELIQSVFNDNVRDFQGTNSVNDQIAGSLNGTKRDAFVILNNGITVICERLDTLRKSFTLSNFQIINGCQTSHVLYLNRLSLGDEVYVTVKIICSESESLTSDIIWSTNNQTVVKKDDLLAATHYQRVLEEYYSHIDQEKRLYYERRSKQYDSKNIPKTRIVDKTTQIKCIGSLYFDQPDTATRYFGSLFSELGQKIFQEDHKPEIYYVAAYALHRIDQLFRQRILDSKYKKIKFFLLMRFKFEVVGHKLSAFNSKDIVKECDEMLKVLHDDTKLRAILETIFSKIDQLGENLSSVELSKSNLFAKKCRDIYVRG